MYFALHSGINSPFCEPLYRPHITHRKLLDCTFIINSWLIALGFHLFKPLFCSEFNECSQKYEKWSAQDFPLTFNTYCDVNTLISCLFQQTGQASQRGARTKKILGPCHKIKSLSINLTKTKITLVSINSLLACVPSWFSNIPKPLCSTDREAHLHHHLVNERYCRILNKKLYLQR